MPQNKDYIERLAPGGEGCGCTGCHRPTVSGDKALPGWKRPKGSPADDLGLVHRLGMGAYVIERRGWLDHLYRTREPGGQITWHSEPYIGFQHEEDLDRLHELGWLIVGLTPGYHHPGTISLSFRRP